MFLLSSIFAILFSTIFCSIEIKTASIEKYDNQKLSLKKKYAITTVNNPSVTPFTKIDSITLKSTDTLHIYINAKPQIYQALAILNDSHKNFKTIGAQSKNGNLVFKITPKTLAGWHPGDSSLKIVLGTHADNKDAESVEWLMGLLKFDIEEPVLSHPANPLDAFHPLPEIRHVFREDVKRPHALLSYVFTVIVLAPWILLLKQWRKLEVNLRNFHYSFSSILFIASIVGINYVLVRAWISWQLFQTIGYLFALSVVTVLSGKSALGQISI
ncbi:hypothetical protein ROZALSC1DRAFT_20697 [Rozella allomycis CSF55]|uniref:Ribophorin II C-terminal domain-containing protein n=1 Tax=Rozella allomycis (strain CSF55) TaxID=988480 RepID=A0A4P9YNR0_ROZAC|nr:hypothetical protein ROZALSC1DRAFT_20697 [Rozella allomycis CSF55]